MSEEMKEARLEMIREAAEKINAEKNQELSLDSENWKDVAEFEEW